MSARAYYNEHDPFAAQWLRNLIAADLIAPGDVDARDIQDVQPADLDGYTQCHFFAGIGGWSYACRLAGWPDDEPIWTGSCPCQPLSSAARGRHVVADLWPHLRRLVAARRPRTLVGEQVVRAAWIDRVCVDLEALDYAVGAAILPACSVDLDHARPRIYFAGDTDRDGQSSLSVDAEMDRVSGRRRERRDVGAPHGVPGRVATLQAFGNAIVPQLAAEFLGAYMDARGFVPEGTAQEVAS